MTRAPVDLTGRWALVTGASRRLGRHLALVLAQAGADIVVHYRSAEDEARRVAREIRSLGRRAVLVAADFSRPGAADELVSGVRAATERLDVIVHNVGRYRPQPIDAVSEEEWLATLRTNLVAPVVATNGLLDLMPAEGGSVVAIGDARVQELPADDHATAYRASKAALLLWVRALARRLGPRGVRVNMISPGQLENSVDLPENVSEAIPLGRAGTLDDVAAALLFLLGPGDYVTGAAIDVDGGYAL